MSTDKLKKSCNLQLIKSDLLSRNTSKNLRKRKKQNLTIKPKKSKKKLKKPSNSTNKNLRKKLNKSNKNSQMKKTLKNQIKTKKN